MSGPVGDQERAAVERPPAAATAPPAVEPPAERRGSRSDLPRHLAADALRRRMLAAADALAVVTAAAVTQGGRSVAAGFWAASLVPIWIVLAKLHGLYDRDHRALRHLTADELGSIVAWSTVSTAVCMPLLALTPTEAPSAGRAVALWLAVLLLTPVLRGV